MKNLKNFLMIVVMLLPVVAFAQATGNGYMLASGHVLKQGDMIKCGTGSLIGNEYAHIYTTSENGQVSLNADAAGSLMKVKSINANNTLTLEDSKHVTYTCEINYAVRNSEVIVISQTHGKTTTADNIKMAGKPAIAKLSVVNNDVSTTNHMVSVMKRMNGNGSY